MPKIIDTEQYRKELLHQCFDLFAEKGYAQVTTRQIARELGISTGAMYHYFPSKQALFEQLVDEMSWQDRHLFQSAAGGNTIADRIQVLGDLLIQHEERFVKQAVIWTDFYQHNALRDISDNPIFQQIDERYQQAIAELLDLSDPKLVRLIWTLVNGILFDHVEQDGRFSFPEQIQLLTQMLIAYCEKYLP